MILHPLFLAVDAVAIANDSAVFGRMFARLAKQLDVHDARILGAEGETERSGRFPHPCETPALVMFGASAAADAHFSIARTAKRAPVVAHGIATDGNTST